MANKKQAVQVYVRIRPMNRQEIENKSPKVLETNKKEIKARQHFNDKITRKFSFDRVFDSSSTQDSVFSEVCQPMLNEVLQGYNCTVFAYGQTGTGKTYTMVGHSEDSSNTGCYTEDKEVGIIPRAVDHLFDELRVQNIDSCVRVSYLELYNEELFDLLSPCEDSTKLRIFDDANRKGSVIVQGLNEVTVHRRSDVYKLLSQGAMKRQTAATLMNAQSSRSHTIFSVTIHLKEQIVGEDVVKVGKLNLVDLAGSENIGRSGAVDKRAREAGNINQSLLTLGRVITALVERTPHIPYRESKLTRLLQDSLGGKTKTSIIATVSPALCNLEETMSTLEYAFRSRNITNKPEVNQKLSSKTLLREYEDELERLKKDLMAARFCNGVYIDTENYDAMLRDMENYKLECVEKVNQIRMLKMEHEKNTRLIQDLKLNACVFKSEMNELAEKYSAAKQNLGVIRRNLVNVQAICREQKYLLEKHMESEKKLGGEAVSLLKIAETTISDVEFLHNKVDVLHQNCALNKNMFWQCYEQLARHMSAVQDDLTAHFGRTVSRSDQMQQRIQEIGKFCGEFATSTDAMFQQFRQLKSKEIEDFGQLEKLLRASGEERVKAFGERLKEDVVQRWAAGEALVVDVLKTIHSLVNSFQGIVFSKEEDFNRHNDYMNEAFSKLQSSTKQRINEIEQHFTAAIEGQQNVQKMQESENKDREEFFASMFKLLKQHEQTWTNNQEKISGEQQKLTENLGKLQAATVGLDSEHETATKSLISQHADAGKKTQAVTKDVAKSLKSHKKQFAQNAQKIIENGQSIVENVPAFVGDVTAIVDHCSSILADYGSSHAIEKPVDDLCSKHKSVLQTCCDRIASNVEENLKTLEAAEDDSKNCEANVTISLDHCVHELHTEMKTKLVEYLKTGNTPQRKGYSLPKKLTRMLPHAKLLYNFRKKHTPSPCFLSKSLVENTEPEDRIKRSKSESDLGKVLKNVSPMATPQRHIYPQAGELITCRIPQAKTKLRQVFKTKTISEKNT